MICFKTRSLAVFRLRTDPLRSSHSGPSGVARNFSQGVRNSVLVSSLQPTSFTVIHCLLSVVFIGVCTNCRFLYATQVELQPQSINGLDRTDINADLSKMVYYITCSIGLLVL